MNHKLCEDKYNILYDTKFIGNNVIRRKSQEYELQHLYIRTTIIIWLYGSVYLSYNGLNNEPQIGLCQEKQKDKYE